MGKRDQIVLYYVLGLIVFLILVFTYTEYTGRTHIIADYYAPVGMYNLSDGNALSADDLQQFISLYNPNIENTTGVKLLHFCREYQVNPAFVLGIAEADSSQGMAGAGRINKNPGNTKISYSALDKVGIKHAWYRAPNNFAVFKTWGDGYAAIALTLNNYRYYNLRGQLDPILRTYAGNPNPNYYNIVKGVMNKLLAKVDIKVKVKSLYARRSMKDVQVLLRNDGKTIAKKKLKQNGMVVFNNLPRNEYVLKIISKNFRPYQDRLTSLQKTTVVKVDLLAKNRSYIAGKVQKLIMSLPDNEGVILRLNGEDGELVRRSRTSKNGFYYFGNLIPGRYVVSIESEIDIPTGFYYTQRINLSKRPKSKVNFIY